MFLSASFPGFKNLTSAGLQDYLKRRLPDEVVFVKAEAGYDFTLKVPLSVVNGLKS